MRLVMRTMLAIAAVVVIAVLLALTWGCWVPSAIAAPMPTAPCTKLPILTSQICWPPPAP